MAEPPAGVPEKELDRLYHGPLEEFTAARNDLAKSLRSEGKGEAADWVKALKKPTRAAWLVNQLATQKKREIKALLEVGAELRHDQEELLAGSVDQEALRDEARREQEAIAALVRTAEAIGREHGVGSQILDRVAETLQAASNDPDVARAIELGHLDREQRAVSIGIAKGAVPAPPAKEERAKDSAAERRARQQTARRRKAAESKVTAAEKKLQRAQATVDRARETLEERQRALHDADLDLRAARRELEEQ